MTELVTFLLPALPLLALLVALLAGCYPGCEAVVRLAERIAAGRRSLIGAASGRSQLASLPSFARRGGLLLAHSLSGRAPPAAA
ncbi:MAG TPA: hypothetical protein VI039_06860 [Solirubrobacterales bacterium]